MSLEAKPIEIKKLEPVANRSFSAKKAKLFIEDVKTEFNKIHWTSRDELITYTKIVIISTFVLGMAIYFVDMFIQAALQSLSFLVQLISG